jgi:hypothetical protein
MRFTSLPAFLGVLLTDIWQPDRDVRGQKIRPQT